MHVSVFLEEKCVPEWFWMRKTVNASLVMKTRVVHCDRIVVHFNKGYNYIVKA